MATAPSPNDLTRQQLDELDVLLQRMLALPLNPPESAPEPPRAPELPPELPAPRNWRVDPPAPHSGPAPHLLVTGVPLPLPDPVVAAPAPMSEERALVGPHAALVPQTRNELRGADRVAATREPEPAPPVVVVRPSFDPEPSAPRPEPPPRPLVGPPTHPALLPLVAVNWLTDRVFGVFGPVAPLFRSRFFKNLFGVAGVGLLVYTALHIIQVRGWVSLPFPLPWPGK